MPPPAGQTSKTYQSVVRATSAAQELRRSATPVTVIDTTQARKETADLGDVLARTEGVGIQRSGGLGSNTRLSLNGFTDNQVRIFVDGIPINMSGFGLGTGSIPVDFLDRVEIYQGVVPIEFGADALGGAVNLVTRGSPLGTGGSVSFQTGSFGTHRLTGGVYHALGKSGIYVRAFGALDYATNDYLVDVQVADSNGQLHDATVRRFHDRYQAQSGGLEVGVVDRPWAERLVLRAFASHYYKDLQSNLSMDIPYGDAGYSDLSVGATLLYANHFWGRRIGVTSRTGFGYERNDFVDLGMWIYDWFGQQIGPRLSPGELSSTGSNRSTYAWSAFERLLVEGRINPNHSLELSLAPTYTTRSGQERQTPAGTLDLLTIPQWMTSLNTGLAYKLRLFGGRVENVLFLKNYYYNVRTRAVSNFAGQFVDERYDNSSFGYGDMFRVRTIDQLYVKASVEQATRLPRAEEVFGNNVTIINNDQLRPEKSLNVNLSLLYDGDMTRLGRLAVEATGFYRRATDLIALLGQSDVNLQYQNIASATSMGAQGRVGWTSPGRYFATEWNGTYMDYRNTSTDGYFAQFNGDRITNMPYLFGNGSARLQWRGLVVPTDSISLQWHLHYVHWFYRSWENIGIQSTKAVIPSQLTQSIGLTYEVVRDHRRYISTIEADNFTDAKTYDFYGLQRPGRAIYWKGIIEFQ